MTGRLYRRRPWLAGLLTFISPGVGHLYAFRPLRAVGALLLSLAGVGIMVGIATGIDWKPWNVVLGVGTALGLMAAIIVDAVLCARAVPVSAPRPRYDRWYVYVPLMVVIAFGVRDPVAAAIRQHWAEAYRVPSGSMEPTLLIGDLMFVRKPRPSPVELKHGAVVVFESVGSPGLQVVSRIVGLPGDTLAMQSGRLLRNGAPVEEAYTLAAAPGRHEKPEVRAAMAGWQAAHRIGDAEDLPDLNEWGPIVVPTDAVFTLGDNRDASYDGRYWGFLPIANIIGHPATVYYSYDPDAPAALPALSAPRWDRVGIRIAQPSR